MLSDLFKVKTKHFQSITEAAVGAERSILHFGLEAEIRCDCTSKKLDYSPERQLSSNGPI
jgi:hypothetical protein